MVVVFSKRPNRLGGLVTLNEKLVGSNEGKLSVKYNVNGPDPSSTVC